MPTASTSSSRAKTTRKTRSTARRDPLAIKLLKADHRQVEAWFDEYEQLDDDADKLELFGKIATALKVHTAIEEEIFYPASRGVVDDDLMDEAYVEHASAKHMIAEIEKMRPGDEFYDAKVKVLGEYVKHHVKEEEQAGGMFSQAKRGDEDLEAIGERLQARKAQIEEQITSRGRRGRA
jgi:hemerythrin superfamily protein